MTDHLLALSSDLGRFLLQSGQSLATAESCTGGLIAATLTEVAGSSGWFGWGVVSYANAAKMQLLAVQPETLHDHGAVSEAVVRQMATGVQRLSGADWSIAVSGVAGPGGGSAAKPVGTVWFAIADPDMRVEAFVHHFSGDRAGIRWQTVETALFALIARVAGQTSQA
ncbi:nicotinamide-nucleotide amidohydrolase family protein [Laribacter hongkongensis]|uniref:CinA family protein n=1 Tax=Laribacter hongkongensis TaxID=168471 RepID=UPI001EFEE890|nr:nicotinamide-nucleotide amidohydrolase family protein [Laribacter hongkongensis]MCG8996707.1 nicotinamide-nucleotide amidohydrolase family protein [Laribacter hongkongensis]MCG9011948.1 nicotinamide-nucleotide amidohydrolase family protein [Laribacter hongkongensis]MCG9023250.1 nicotinamide-nucleotide amidohydrolase family protein [Laribacter hongkongensis]MCG9048458.1 nicotinamide-nucleotide amidohydrolase family protein [Laribacter hongkongensis]MCG9075401.1 nicotinamide-nucleotide amidoh